MPFYERIDDIRFVIIGALRKRLEELNYEIRQQQPIVAALGKIVKELVPQKITEIASTFIPTLPYQVKEAKIEYVKTILDKLSSKEITNIEELHNVISSIITDPKTRDVNTSRTFQTLRAISDYLDILVNQQYGLRGYTTDEEVISQLTEIMQKEYKEYALLETHKAETAGSIPYYKAIKSHVSPESERKLEEKAKTATESLTEEKPLGDILVSMKTLIATDYFCSRTSETFAYLSAMQTMQELTQNLVKKSTPTEEPSEKFRP